LRDARGWSQRSLATAADVSARHISFLESGRAQPSRFTAVRLALALDLPIEPRNELLLAAGFAPAWTGEDGPLPSALLEAIHRMMAKHEPYPLYVCNRARDVQHANRATLRLLAAFLGDSMPSSGPLNVLRLLFDPTLARPFVLDWERTAAHMLALAHRDALRHPEDRQLAARLREVQDLESFHDHERIWDETPPVFTVRLAKDALRANFFTTVTTFGGPQTAAIEELTIESWFPLDAETDAACRALATEPADAKARLRGA
jgi:transcriptional regulator with XRE-family HTH domain